MTCDTDQKIEITQEMMEAGARILLNACGYSAGNSTVELVAQDIFLTMLEVRAKELTDVKAKEAEIRHRIKSIVEILNDPT